MRNHPQYDRRLAELEDRYQSGEWTLEQLNAAVVELDAEWDEAAERAHQARPASIGC